MVIKINTSCAEEGRVTCSRSSVVVDNFEILLESFMVLIRSDFDRGSSFAANESRLCSSRSEAASLDYLLGIFEASRTSFDEASRTFGCHEDRVSIVLTILR
jgi:hypothetical protein